MSDSPRARIYSIVKATSKKSGRSMAVLFDKLYYDFEQLTNLAVRRVAHNSQRSALDVVEAEGRILELLDLARKKFIGNPSSTEKEKAPVQGSLLEGEQ